MHYIQCAIALPSVEQEPTELTGARTDFCGQSKNQRYMKLRVFSLAIQALPLCLPLSARKILSISLKSGSELECMEKTPGCCVAVDAYFQQEGLLSQLFLASSKFL